MVIFMQKHQIKECLKEYQHIQIHFQKVSSPQDLAQTVTGRLHRRVNLKEYMNKRHRKRDLNMHPLLVLHMEEQGLDLVSHDLLWVLPKGMIKLIT